MAIKGRRIELRDGSDPTLAIHETFPKRFQVASDRGNHSYTSHNDFSIAHRLSDRPLVRLIDLSKRNLRPQQLESRVSRSHSDHLYLLEELSFRPDRGRNDDLGLLKFPDVGCPDVTHAGRYGSDKVLTPIIDVSGTEKNLSKRSGCANANSGSTR